MRKEMKKIRLKLLPKCLEELNEEDELLEKMEYVD